MNPNHCPSCGKFSSAPRAGGREGRRGDLLKAMQGDMPPSEPHCRAERTKAAKRAEKRLEHLRGWQALGFVVPKAVRLLGGGTC